MSLILSGTDGLSDVDGSAATPAIRGTDANTGIFFPAADTIAFAEGGAEVARFDSSGNFGIGTTSPASTLDVVASGVATGTIRTSSTTGSREAKLRLNVPSTGGDDPAGQIEFTYGTGYTVAGSIQMTHTNPNMKFFTGTSERVRIDANGNVFIGDTANTTGSPTFYIKPKAGFVAQIAGFNFNTTSTAANPNNNLLGSGNYYNGTSFVATQTTATLYQQSGAEHLWYSGTGLTAGNTFTPTERMRIDSSGNLLVGTTSSAITTAGILLKPAGNSASVPLVGSSGASSSSSEITMAVYSTTAAQYQFYVAYNGQATGRFTYATFSDARLKTNISSIQNGLATITALNPVTFNFLPAKDQTENSDLKYGFIAQEVQQLLPTLVNEGLDKAEDETPYLTLQTGDLLPIAIKAIQEQQALIVSMREEIDALKTKVGT